ncbi:MAG: TolC family protein [Burkholderiales bacterium]
MSGSPGRAPARLALFIAAACVALPLHAQTSAPVDAPVLTLREAERIALANRPLLKARRFAAEGAHQARLQLEAARYPQLAGNVTAVTAHRETDIQNGREVALDTRIAAGGLNNPTVLRRDAAGLTVSQLLTDFGRTNHLVGAAASLEQAQKAQVEATRAQVMLDVSLAYYSALEAQSVLRVARKTVEARKVLVDRVTALMASKLKAELDVRFAEVNLEEARLLELRARNAVEAAFARLAAALGERSTRPVTLAEPPDGGDPPVNPELLVQQAMASRPDLAGLRAEREATRRFVDAQGAMRYPTVSAFAAAGVVPVGDDRFPRNYGAIGVNVNLTLFDGGKISALRDEARARALQASETLTEAENNVTSAVRVAWLNATAAHENIGITAHLRDVSAAALKLAETRYTLGITSVIEVNQAQLSAIDAEIGYGRARYEYLRALATLDFQLGKL